MLNVFVQFLSGRGGREPAEALLELLRPAFAGLEDSLLELAGDRPPLLACRSRQLAGLFPRCRRVVLQEDGRAWDHWSGALAGAAGFAAPGRGLLVVSPGLGPVGAELLGDFLRQSLDHPGKVAVAAGELHHNLHPSWALRPSEEERDGGVLCLESPGTIRPDEFLAPEAWPYFPPVERIGRSQDVPKIYKAHGSFVLAPESWNARGSLSPSEVAAVPLGRDDLLPVHVLAGYLERPLY